MKLPAGKILIPGVASHPTELVEHPELIGDRIIAFAEWSAKKIIIPYFLPDTIVSGSMPCRSLFVIRITCQNRPIVVSYC